MPKKKIEEADNDGAHLDAEAAKIIHFLNASVDHKFLVDETMTQEQGLTFDVYKESDEAEEPPAEEPPAEEEEGEEGAEPKPVKEPEEQFPKHVFVKEVVREPRMHFYRVPKLGSYLSVKLEYNCCLFEEALDAAIANTLEVKQKLED